MKRHRVWLLAVGVGVIAGCSWRLGDSRLFNRFSRDTPVLTDEIVSEEIVDRRPIMAAPDGLPPVEAPDQLGPTPRVVPPQPMAKPLPYAPEDEEKKKPEGSETKNEKKAEKKAEP